jgi:hypothetical protein
VLFAGFSFLVLVLFSVPSAFADFSHSRSRCVLPWRFIDLCADFRFSSAGPRVQERAEDFLANLLWSRSIAAPGEHAAASSFLFALAKSPGPRLLFLPAQ